MKESWKSHGRVLKISEGLMNLSVCLSKQDPHDRSVLLRLKIIRSRTIKDAPTFSFQGGSRPAFVTLVLSLEDTEVTL